MEIDKQILEEIRRYKEINNYIMEQPAPPTGEAPVGDLGADLPPAPEGEIPPAEPGAEAGMPPAPEAPAEPEGPTPIDVAADTDVEEVETEEEGGEEEIDITDLVDTQKTMSDKQEEYFNNLFSQLSNLESKLGEMDQLVSKINDLEAKFDKYRPKTPEEKLELRSLDSGPFKQKLSDFFMDKQEDMEKSGKNEYVLTTDDVEEYSPEEIKTTFNDFGTDEEMM